MKPVYLIGSNGDQINLCTPEFQVAQNPILGSTRPKISYRSGVFGRRVEQIRQDSLLSNFVVQVWGATTQQHDDNRSRLIDALRSRTAPVRLIIERHDGTQRVQIGFDVGQDSGVADIQARRSVVPVLLESVERPYWVSLTQQLSSTVIGVSATVLWTGQMPIGGSTVTPTPIGWPWSISGYYIADADSQTLVHHSLGTVPTWPEWIINGPATAVELINERTGKVFEWTGTLGANIELRISTDPLNRSVKIGVANVWYQTTVGSQMSELLPGENRIQVNLAGGVDPDTTVTLRSYDRFTSP